MKTINQDGSILLELNTDEALILFEWLFKFNERTADEKNVDESAEIILFDLEAELEKKVSLLPNYKSALLSARKKLKNN